MEQQTTEPAKKPRKKRNKDVDAETLAKMREMDERGEKRTYIAAFFGYDHSVVTKRLGPKAKASA